MFVLTFRCIMVSLYSTLSSSSLLRVEFTRGMKSEAILTPGRPRGRGPICIITIYLSSLIFL